MPKKAPLHQPIHKRFDGPKHICPKLKAKRRAQDKQRAKDPIRRLYWSKRWREESKDFLRDHAFCTEADCDRPSDTVDHRIPHKGDLNLFWDRSNWRATCHRCHSRKTARQDGGFGNPVKGNRT